MSRFIARYRETGTPVSEATARLRAVPRVTVVDQSSRMVLVEAPEAMEAALREALPGWVIARERMVPVPTTRPTPHQEPVAPRP